nr:GntR family transcriptional regulator [Sulfobacillus harzensis]
MDEQTLRYIPKYYRIRQDLLEKIRDGRFPAGSSIPSETELCAIYGVSRGTIRRALDELDRSGLIERAPGRSTTVCTPKIPLLASGFRSDIANKGLRPGTEVLSITAAEPPWDVARLLGIPGGRTVDIIERVISANDTPLVVETVFIRSLKEAIVESEVKSNSLLTLIPVKSRAILSRAVETYEPIILAAEDATLLGCSQGDLAIRDQAVLYDGDGCPLYVSIAIVRGDRAKIVTEATFSVI